MKLNTLTDSELLNTTKTFVGRERNITVDLLWHLIEIEKRELHLAQGYSSLFDYLTSGLKFSKSGAGRRITAARCMRDNPEVEAMLRSGELNLSTVCEVNHAVSEDKGALKRFSGVSKREAKEIAAEYKPAPKRKIKDTIKPLGRKVEAESLPLLEPTPTGGSRGISNLAPVKSEVRFEAGAEFTERLEEVRAVLSNKLGAGASLEEVLGVCMEVCLEKHCPKRKEARRVKRERRSTDQTRSDPSLRSTRLSSSKSGQAPTRKVGSRHIPARVRAEVMRRDGYQCTFTGEDGRRCGCKTNLQIDHKRPFAVGGGSESENLRVLCRAHNLFEAKQCFGEGLVKHCIEKAKAA